MARTLAGIETRLRTFKDIDLNKKRVLVRVDLNVPIKDGTILDTSRIDAIVPTVKALLKKGAEVILMSHLGRPKGMLNPDLSLKILVPTLSKAIGVPVIFEGNGAVNLLENLRFNPGEESNCTQYAATLAEKADVYINDAFAVSHRAHASVCAITKLLPSYAGLLLEKEVSFLESALSSNAHPVAAIVGGAKVSTKFELLASLVKKVDMLIVGGGIANTFAFAQGISIGASLHEPDAKDLALEIIATARANDCTIIMPTDVVVASDPGDITTVREIGPLDVKIQEAIYDVGPKTIAKITQGLSRMKTLLWNGPLGYFEQPPFERGTLMLAKEVARLTKDNGLCSIAGGGETVAALKQSGRANDFTYLSTGGGAFLEYIEGRQLPGIYSLTSL